jgi:hypothetical protein
MLAAQRAGARLAASAISMKSKEKSPMETLKCVLVRISESLDKAGGAVSRQTKLALRAHRKKKFAMAMALTVFIVCCLALSAYLLVEKGSQASFSALLPAQPENLPLCLSGRP